MGNNVLVLFSGGKDSFLTAARLAGKKEVVLLSCNNGCIYGEEIFMHGVRRLKNRYGSRISFAGVSSTAATVMRLSEYWAKTRVETIAKEYSRLIPPQVTCLHCQSAMWCEGIAYCKAKGIEEIASGYKSTDLFCTGMEFYVECIKELAQSNNVSALFPVWHGWEEYEFLDRGFEPSIYEPKCMVGRPVKPMEDMDKVCLEKYFREHILPLMQGQIDKLEPILSKIRLSEKSMDVITYPVPDGSSGLY